MIALAAACVAITLGQPENVPPSPAVPPPGGRVCHLRILGDLECRGLVDEVAGELERAKRERAALVLLELESERARPDLVLEVGRRMRACGVPVTVYVHNGPGGRVGAGALQIGQLASACYIAPRTTVRTAAADDLRWMAPAGVDWERTTQDLSGAIWGSLKERGVDLALPSVLTMPAQPCWAIPGEAGRWRVTLGDPPGGRAKQIVFAGAEFERIEMDAAAVVDLGLAREAGSVAQVLAAEGRGLASRSSRTLKGGLGEAKRLVMSTLDDSRVASRRIGELLDVRKRAQGRTITRSDYHRAARDALAELARAAADLDAAEQVIVRYPEVLREPPAPGGKRTRGALDPISASLAERRKDLEKWRAVAREYESR